MFYLALYQFGLVKHHDLWIRHFQLNFSTIFFHICLYCTCVYNCWNILSCTLSIWIGKTPWPMDSRLSTKFPYNFIPCLSVLYMCPQLLEHFLQAFGSSWFLNVLSCTLSVWIGKTPWPMDSPLSTKFLYNFIPCLSVLYMCPQLLEHFLQAFGS